MNYLRMEEITNENTEIQYHQIRLKNAGAGCPYLRPRRSKFCMHLYLPRSEKA